MTAKMWTVLPKDHADNGVGLIEQAIVDDPDEEYFVMIKVNQRRFTNDADTRESTPALRVLRFEPMLGERHKIAEALMDEARDARTGQRKLFDGAGQPPGDDE